MAADVPVQLRCLGFCGADDSVDPEKLKEISEKHGWVEWGVLFRPDKCGSPRFASDEWLKQLGQVNSARRMRLAGHLCATHVDGLLRGDTSFVRKLHDVPPPPCLPMPKPHSSTTQSPDTLRAPSSPAWRDITAGGISEGAGQRDRRQRCRRDHVRRRGRGGGVRRVAAAGETRTSLNPPIPPNSSPPHPPPLPLLPPL